MWAAQPNPYSWSISNGGGLGISIPSSSSSHYLTSTYSAAGNPPTEVSFGEELEPWNVPHNGSSTVILRGPSYTVTRHYKAEYNRIVVADTFDISPTAATSVGIEVTHTATFQDPVTVTEASVPGALYPFQCDSHNPDGHSKLHHGHSKLHRGTFGNPSVHAAGSNGGIALLALDDVLEAQGYMWQKALPRYPRMPPSTPPCAVTSPPSIGITNSHFALPPGARYTMRFALYVLTSDCRDYWCFINRARSDVGATNLTIAGAGYLSFAQPMRERALFAAAGYKDWSEMRVGEFAALLEHESLHFVHAATPRAGRAETCRPGVDENCHGSCFVTELPASELAYLERLLNLSEAAAPELPRLLYVDTLLSGERGAMATYADSAITDADGYHVCYENCSAGCDYPMFFNTNDNSYGAVLDAYFDKALGLGFDGLYHDEFLASATSFTFSAHDGYSAVLDPAYKNVSRLIGHVALLSQQHEIRLIQKVRGRNGSMVFNGAPSTQTTRAFAQQGEGGNRVAGGRGGASLHFVEDSQECRVRWTHLHTPIALLRFGGQKHDEDPKYDGTCPPNATLTYCMGKNVYDHLDFGVLPYLYDGLWRNATTPTLMARLFPATPIELRSGSVLCRERLITKVGGTFSAPPDARGGKYEVFLYQYSEPIGSGPNATGSGPNVTIPPLREGQIVVVVPAR